MTQNNLAKRSRYLLEAYKGESISNSEKKELFDAIRACLQISMNSSERRYFEIIVNRYLLQKPLKLAEIAEVYQISPESVSTWEVKKGFELLTSANTRMKSEERLHKWIKTMGKQGTERERAKKLWMISGQTLTPMEIGRVLGVSNKLISKWKAKDRWEDEYKNVQRNHIRPGG